MKLAFAAAGVVQCGGRKTSSRTSTIEQFMFHFCPYEMSKHILRNQNLITGLDLYSRQRFIYLESKKISTDQELIQSDPTSCPQIQKGNN